MSLQCPFSTNFLLSGGDADAFSGRFPPTEHSHTAPSAIDLLDAATACSTQTFLGSASPAATKRLKDVFLVEARAPDPTPQLKPMPAAAVAASTEEGLHLQLTSALRTNSELAADVKMLREENDALRRTSVLTRSTPGVQRDLNATSINLLEEQDEQSLDARLIVSLRTTISSLEQQNRALEEQVRDLQGQLSALAASKAGADTEMRENGTVAKSLHQQLESALQRLAVLTQENNYKDELIGALREEAERMRGQLHKQASANLSLSQYMSRSAASGMESSGVSVVDLQGKLEQCRLMNRQYEESMATLLDEQKATGELLATLMERATMMDSRLCSIEKQVVAVTRDHLVDIYRRRLESIMTNASK